MSDLKGEENILWDWRLQVHGLVGAITPIYRDAIVGLRQDVVVIIRASEIGDEGFVARALSERIEPCIKRRRVRASVQEASIKALNEALPVFR